MGNVQLDVTNFLLQTLDVNKVSDSVSRAKLCVDLVNSGLPRAKRIDKALLYLRR